MQILHDHNHKTTNSNETGQIFCEWLVLTATIFHCKRKRITTSMWHTAIWITVIVIPSVHVWASRLDVFQMIVLIQYHYLTFISDSIYNKTLHCDSFNTIWIRSDMLTLKNTVGLYMEGKLHISIISHLKVPSNFSLSCTTTGIVRLLPGSLCISQFDTACTVWDPVHPRALTDMNLTTEMGTRAIVTDSSHFPRAGFLSPLRHRLCHFDQKRR